MNYCRFSTNDFQCDLYYYEDCSGEFTTHVASNRRIFNAPLSQVLEIESSGWLERPHRVMEMVEQATHEKIGLPYDGESFNDPDLESFLSRLLLLQKTGYKFPDYVIDRARSELLEIEAQR